MTDNVAIELHHGLIVELIKQDKDTLPLYGSVTGLSLPVEPRRVAPGVILRSGLFEIFSSPVMAFAEAPPGGHTPAPWIPVDGAYQSFQARAELALENISVFGDFAPSKAMWLLAVLLRLRIEAPVRVAVVANVPLKTLKARADIWPLSFEAAPNQNGIFRGQRVDVTEDDLNWLCDTLPVALGLFRDQRFMRALTIFDESVWASRLEIGTVFMWTAIEIPFECSGEQNKTKAISLALADCVGRDKADRDRAYQIIAELYGKRGRVVHSGRNIEEVDFIQSRALARAAFMNVLGRRELPKSRELRFSGA